jgi:hypothetical protein
MEGTMALISHSLFLSLFGNLSDSTELQGMRSDLTLPA